MFIVNIEIAGDIIKVSKANLLKKTRKYKM